MQLSLGDDSDDEDISDPRKELKSYLESKREDRNEGLVEWWGVSMFAHRHTFLLTDHRPTLAQFPSLSHPRPHCARLSRNPRVLSCFGVCVFKWSAYWDIPTKSTQDGHI